MRQIQIGSSKFLRPCVAFRATHNFLMSGSLPNLLFWQSEEKLSCTAHDSDSLLPAHSSATPKPPGRRTRKRKV